MKKSVVIILALVAIATILCVPVSAARPSGAVRYYTSEIPRDGTTQIYISCRSTNWMEQGTFNATLYAWTDLGEWVAFLPMEPVNAGYYPRSVIKIPPPGTLKWFADIEATSDKIFCSVCWNTDTTGIRPCYLPGDFYVANL